MSRLPIRGGQTVNAQFDTPGISDDVVFQQTSGAVQKKRKTVYPPPTNRTDRSMIIGEVAVTRSKGWTPGTQEDVRVRTALNGMTIPCTSNDEKEQLVMMREKIRPAGVMSKTVQYDAARPDLDPSDQPTFLVSGHLTVTNTGGKNIEAGNVVIAKLMPVGTTGQYMDGVNVFSPNRVVMGYEPLTMHRDMREILRDKSHPLTLALVAVCNNIAAAEGRGMTGPAVFAKIEGHILSNNEAQKTANRMLHAARAASIAQMRRVVGVSTTGCDQGQRFNLASQPLPNVVTRSRVPVV